MFEKCPNCSQLVTAPMCVRNRTDSPDGRSEEEEGDDECEVER